MAKKKDVEKEVDGVEVAAEIEEVANPPDRKETRPKNRAVKVGIKSFRVANAEKLAALK